jgi:hypothetical protein
MAVNDFNSGGSSVLAASKLSALQELIYDHGSAESRRNRNQPLSQTNFVSFAIASDAQTTLTATVTMPARMVQDETTGNVSLQPDEIFGAEYLSYTAGTGDLAGTTTATQGLIKLAKTCTYLERQIDPNVVIQRADQVTLLEDIEQGQIVLTCNLPLDVEKDATTGEYKFVPFDYLRILGF